jgi:hypothetical protein
MKTYTIKAGFAFRVSDTDVRYGGEKIDLADDVARTHAEKIDLVDAAALAQPAASDAE